MLFVFAPRGEREMTWTIVTSDAFIVTATAVYAIVVALFVYTVIRRIEE